MFYSFPFITIPRRRVVSRGERNQSEGERDATRSLPASHGRLFGSWSRSGSGFVEEALLKKAGEERQAEDSQTTLYVMVLPEYRQKPANCLPRGRRSPGV